MKQHSSVDMHIIILLLQGCTLLLRNGILDMKALVSALLEEIVRKQRELGDSCLTCAYHIEFEFRAG
jgi:hypothetical protein